MKLAIVGCGGIASGTARAANMNEKIQLVAVCDVTEAGAREFAARHDIPTAYGDYAAMLNCEALDAVYLAVPHYLHLPMTLAAFEKGLNVFCEKPIAVSVAEGQAMADAARKAGLKLGINYQYRYDADCYQMVTSAQRGDLGEIFYARCHVPFHREPGYYAGWHAIQAQAGGGTMLTVGSHMLDLVLWACQSQPRRAKGMLAHKRFKDIEVEDLAMGIVELESGVLVEICSSMVATPEKISSVELYGALDTAYFPPEERSENFVSALVSSLEGFRAWVEEDVPYRTPAEQALPALAAVEMIYQSAAE